MSWNRPCDVCRVLTRADLLVDVSDTFPLKLACADCAEEIASESDPGDCTCTACTRLRPTVPVVVRARFQPVVVGALVADEE